MRFCTSCQASKPIEGGMMKKTNNGKRWICKDCRNKTQASIYKTKGLTTQDGLRRLMRQLGMVGERNDRC
jgi:hypothetical protein